MDRAYIYLISFKDTNDIYIGKTIVSIKTRFREHKNDKYSSVYLYVKTNFNNDWSNVYIDIIDSIDMNEDLTHLLDHPSNILVFSQHSLNKYTSCYKTKEELLTHKLACTEHFHIHNYKNDGKYNLINKRITNGADVYRIYNFLNYTKTD